jgi:hypothetical protein
MSTAKFKIEKERTNSPTGVMVVLALALSGCGRSPEPSVAGSSGVEPPQSYRYSAVARFDGTFPVFADGSGLTEVEDRFEFVIDVDGDRIIGEPQIANSGSRLVEPGLEEPDCNSLKRTSYFDRATLKSVELDQESTLNLQIETHLAGYEAPPECSWSSRSAEPRQDQWTLKAPIPVEGLRAAGGGPIEIREDGWSISFTRRPIDTEERHSSP